MTKTLGGPAIVLAVVLAETAVGGVVVLWLSELWGSVKTAFFKLIAAVLSACAMLAWAAARGPLHDTAASRHAGVALALLAAFAAATLVWQVLLWARALEASRWVSIASIPLGIGALLALAAHPDVPRAPWLAGFQLLAGALFAGAVTDGLILGHWYLVDRKLSGTPLARVNRLFLAGCAAAAVAVLAGGTGGGQARADLSPLLGVGLLTVALSVGLIAVCALIGVFIRALVKERSIQAATGFFYLAVIMALAAEFAAKVRFF